LLLLHYDTSSHRDFDTDVAMGGQLAFLPTQIIFKPKPLPSGVRLDQQTAIITGSNVGIGLETARQLALHGVSRITLGVRDVSKGNAAKDDLAKSSPNCDFQVWELHQDSYDSIVAFSEKAKSLDRIDIVLLNAGVKQLK
jgi:retinol dehydrogenase-12